MQNLFCLLLQTLQTSIKLRVLSDFLFYIYFFYFVRLCSEQLWLPSNFRKLDFWAVQISFDREAKKK